MLTPHLRSQFVTKILTSADGREYKVVFLVALVDGEVKAQVISAEPVTVNSKSQATGPLCLPCITIKNTVTSSKSDFSTQVYLHSFLEFFTSQPTRAPSL